MADLKGEESGEGLTEKLRQYEIYQKMLADWFNEAPEKAVNKADEFEKAVKKKFIEEPGQMKLLIVVDKLLTGFDAPPATYLYIDKQMQRPRPVPGHLPGEPAGWRRQGIRLHHRLQGPVQESGGGGQGLHLRRPGRLRQGRRGRTAEGPADQGPGAIWKRPGEAIKALCEPVEAPKDTAAYLRYFCARDSGNAEQLKENEPKRLALYKLTASLLRAYANMANEMEEAGYTRGRDRQAIKAEVDHYDKVRNEVKLASGDYIDLKMYEPAMRHLIDTYIRAEESEKISAFDDMSLIQLIVERGADAVNELPKGIRENREAVAETIENNVRKLIIDEQPINPKYYEKMSELLDALIEQRKKEALDYQEYLAKIVELTRKAKNPATGYVYPTAMDTGAKRALYDNLDKNESLALAVDHAILRTGWTIGAATPSRSRR